MSELREELTIIARLRDQHLKAGLQAAQRRVREFKTVGGRAFSAVAKAATGLVSAVGALPGLFAGLTAGVSLYVFARIANDMSEAASDAEQLDARFRQLFQERTPEMLEFTTGLADGLGRGRIAMKRATADAFTFFNSMGQGEEISDRLSKGLVQVSLDIAALYNERDDVTLRLLRSSLVGNAEALDRFGVRIDAVSIENRALAEGFARSTDELTQQDKVLARALLTLEAFEKAQGQAAREADSFESRMKGLRGAVTDARAEFGRFINEAVLRAVDELGGLDRARDLFRVFFATVASGARVAIGAIGETLEFLSGAIERAGGAEQLVRGLLDGTGRFARAAESALPGVVTRLEALSGAGLGLLIPDTDLERLAHMESRLASIREERRQLGDDGASLRAGVIPEGEFARETLEHLGDYELALARVKDEYRAARKAEFKFVDGIRELRDNLSPASQRLLELENAATEAAGTSSESGFAALGGEVGALGGQADEAAAAWADFADSLRLAASENTAQELDRVRRATEQAYETAKLNIFDNTVDGLFDVAEGAKSASQALSDLLRIGLRTFAQLGFRATFAPFFGLEAFADGGIVKGGGFYGGGAMPVKGYANGGPIFKGPHIGIIGEGDSPAEAAVPLPDGKTIPVTLKGGGGGDHYTVNFSVSAMDARSVVGLLAENASEVAQMVVAKIQRTPTMRAQVAGGATL